MQRSALHCATAQAALHKVFLTFEKYATGQGVDEREILHFSHCALNNVELRIEANENLQHHISDKWPP